MFAYCNNNPANSSDPTGMCPSCTADRNSDKIVTDVLCGFGGGSTLVAVSGIYVILAEARDSKNETIRNFYDSVTSLISNNGRNNDGAHNIIGYIKIATSIKTMSDGVILAFAPDPTLINEVMGAVKIMLGMKNFIEGLAEIFMGGFN